MHSIRDVPHYVNRGAIAKLVGDRRTAAIESQLQLSENQPFLTVIDDLVAVRFDISKFRELVSRDRHTALNLLRKVTSEIHAVVTENHGIFERQIADRWVATFSSDSALPGDTEPEHDPYVRALDAIRKIGEKYHAMVAGGPAATHFLRIGLAGSSNNSGMASSLFTSVASDGLGGYPMGFISVAVQGEQAVGRNAHALALGLCAMCSVEPMVEYFENNERYLRTMKVYFSSPEGVREFTDAFEDRLSQVFRAKEVARKNYTRGANHSAVAILDLSSAPNSVVAARQELEDRNWTLDELPLNYVESELLKRVGLFRHAPIKTLHMAVPPAQ